MRTLLSKWKFHKAGQGCFYSGIIDAHGKGNFSFVFDCGSTKGSSVLKQEIKDYKSELIKLGSNSIDLLVLSHYDADHVNQLPILLKDISCEVAVLPYLTNGERLMVYFSQRLSDSYDDDDYFSFITDPIAYLSNLNVKRIIFIDGNDDEENGGMQIISPDPFQPQNEAFTRFSNDGEPREGISEPNLKVQVRLKTKGHDNDPEKIEFLSRAEGSAEFALANGSISAGYLWEFFFHEKSQEPLVVFEFREMLRKAFGLDLNGPYPTYAELAAMIKNSKARAKLKGLNIKFFGNPNTSGLVVMHGPLGHRHTESFNNRIHYSGTHCFTLLNGDCDLSDVSYSDYIKATMHYVRYFQVPHHGSWRSWYPNELDQLGPAHMIVNHAQKNRYGHPHKDVTADIKVMTPDWVLKHATEKQNFKYQITTYI